MPTQTSSSRWPSWRRRSARANRTAPAHTHHLPAATKTQVRALRCATPRRQHGRSHNMHRLFALLLQALPGLQRAGQGARDRAAACNCASRSIAIEYFSHAIQLQYSAFTINEI